MINPTQIKKVTVLTELVTAHINTGKTENNASKQNQAMQSNQMWDTQPDW